MFPGGLGYLHKTLKNVIVFRIQTKKRCEKGSAGRASNTMWLPLRERNQSENQKTRQVDQTRPDVPADTVADNLFIFINYFTTKY